MFTGIIEEQGQILDIKYPDDSKQDARLTISASIVLQDAKHGDSIAVNGVCLTITEFNGTQFSADVMPQTVKITTLRNLVKGQKVNLERATAVGSRLGGHIVQGHTDAVGIVKNIHPGQRWREITIDIPENISKYTVEKGSITINGTSLTISKKEHHQITVSLIPTTLAETNLGELTTGTEVNIEVDVLAKYVAQLLGKTNE